MSTFIAALPMYDWPEVRPETDAEWAAIRDRLRKEGIDIARRTVAKYREGMSIPSSVQRRREKKALAGNGT
jgi:hypothetical protein